MSGILLSRQANLDQYPPILKREDRGRHVSVGDMHCNALKLIYTLIEESMFYVNKEQYERLHDIYSKPIEDILAADIKTFERIIERASVNRERSLTLLGDELAGLGKNDYFMLLIIKKLHIERLDLEIMLSYHDVEFIRDFEATASKVHHLTEIPSLTNMQYLIKKGLIQEDQVRQILVEHYEPLLKGISYTISLRGDLTIFSHAPIGLETIEALAKKLLLPYADHSLEILINTIDAINNRLQVLFTAQALTATFDAEGDFLPDVPIPLVAPLTRLVSNRTLGEELRAAPASENYKVSFVHGYIGDGEVKQYMPDIPGSHNTLKLRESHQNLYTSFGKYLEYSHTGLIKVRSHPIHIKHHTRQSSDFTPSQFSEEEKMRLELIKKHQLIASMLDKLVVTMNHLDPAVVDEKMQIKKDLLNELDVQRNQFIAGNINQNDYLKSFDKIIKFAAPLERFFHQAQYSKVILNRTEIKSKEMTPKSGGLFIRSPNRTRESGETAGKERGLDKTIKSKKDAIGFKVENKSMKVENKTFKAEHKSIKGGDSKTIKANIKTISLDGKPIKAAGQTIKENHKSISASDKPMHVSSKPTARSLQEGKNKSGSIAPATNKQKLPSSSHSSFRERFVGKADNKPITEAGNTSTGKLVQTKTTHKSPVRGEAKNKSTQGFKKNPHQTSTQTSKIKLGSESEKKSVFFKQSSKENMKQKHREYKPPSSK